MQQYLDIMQIINSDQSQQSSWRIYHVAAKKYLGVIEWGCNEEAVIIFICNLSQKLTVFWTGNFCIARVLF